MKIQTPMPAPPEALPEKEEFPVTTTLNGGGGEEEETREGGGAMYPPPCQQRSRRLAATATPPVEGACDLLGMNYEGSICCNVPFVIVSSS